MAVSLKKVKELEYFILSVNRKRVDLFNVKGKKVDALKGEWPLVYEELYEYARSTRGTSFGYSAKGFEKDKSVVKENRFVTFLKNADKKLKETLPKKTLLVLAGTDKDRADFKRISNYGASIIGEVRGSYSKYNLTKLLAAAKEFSKPFEM